MKKMLRYCFMALFIFSCVDVRGDENCCGYYSPDNPFSCGPHKAGYGNCTWWAAYQRPDLIGICTRNAVFWFDQVNEAGVPTGQSARVGAIAVFNWWTVNENGEDENFGHVAYVDDLRNNNSFHVTEMGWDTWNGMHESVYNANSLDGLIGFIYDNPIGEFSNGWRRDPITPPNQFEPFSRPFVDCFLGNNGINVLGIPVSEVSQRSSNIYAQEFSNGANERFTLVLNPNVYNSARGYLGVCYPMCGRIRAMWNPNRDGAPVTNEYNVTKGDHPYVVQWFEPTDNNYVCLAYELNMNLFIRDAEKTIGIARDANFNQRLISDQNKNGGGIGGGSPNPTPTYASPPVVTIIDPGTGHREVKTDRARYSPGDKVTVSWSGFESYSHIGVAVSIYRGNERHLTLLDERSRSNYSGSASVSTVV